jgi:hypothetical protein
MKVLPCRRLADAELGRPVGRPKPNPLAREVDRLRRENARLSSCRQTAERIIEIQSGVSALLGIPLAREGGHDRTRS